MLNPPRKIGKGRYLETEVWEAKLHSTHVSVRSARFPIHTAGAAGVGCARSRRCGTDACGAGVFRCLGGGRDFELSRAGFGASLFHAEGWERTDSRSDVQFESAAAEVSSGGWDASGGAGAGDGL